MSEHLGYTKNEPKGKNTGNSRNGKSQKTVHSIHGKIDIDFSRDRNGGFEHKLIRKGEKQLNGFDEL